MTALDSIRDIQQITATNRERERQSDHVIPKRKLCGKPYYSGVCLAALANVICSQTGPCYELRQYLIKVGYSNLASEPDVHFGEQLRPA